MNSGRMAHEIVCLHQELMKLVLAVVMRHRRMKKTTSHNLPRKALMTTST
jgi:hypothetical protein